MKKIFTTLSAVALLGAASLTANAQTAAISTVIPSPSNALTSDSYGLLISNFIIEVSTSDGATVNTSAAAVMLKYQLPSEANPSILNGKIQHNGNSINCSFGGESATESFLKAGETGGATEVQLILTGATVSGGDSEYLTSNVSGCEVGDFGTITVTYSYAKNAGGGGGNTPGIQWQEVKWGEDFTSSLAENTYWEIPQGYSGPIYITSNSDVNLLDMGYNHLLYANFTSEDNNKPVDGLTAVLDGENYVYTLANFNGEYFPYYFVNLYYLEITFSINKGEYEAGGPEESYLTFDDSVTLSLSGNTSAVFKSNKSESSPLGILTNSQESITISLMCDLNMSGMDPFPFEYTTVKTADGYYAFNVASISNTATYTLGYAGFEEVQFTFQDTLVVGETVEGEAEPQEITLEHPFTANPEAPKWAFEVGEDDGIEEVTLYSDNEYNLIANHLLTITNYGVDVTDQWFGVKTADGWAYNGSVNSFSTYIFTYTGSDDVEFTLSETTAEITYMTEDQVPTLVYDDLDPAYPVLNLVWNVSLVGIGAELNGTLTCPGTDEMEQVTLSITTYAPDAEDEPGIAADGNTVVMSNALILPMLEYYAQYGAGEYTISIESIVCDASTGAWNNPYTKTFKVNTLPAESIVEPTVSYSPEEITISWDNQTLAYYNPLKKDIIITDYNDGLNETFTIGEGASISNNALVINISELELVDDVTYYLEIPEAFVYIGADQMQYNGFIQETFDTETTGVSTIETTINGKDVIYNLQGVKVANPTKGLYIINGKKVFVK